MNVIFIVLPLSLVVAAGFLAAFVFAARRGEFDDLDTPAHRMLEDDEATPPSGSDDPPPSDTVSP
jgi:cbb3-type cytochrome oxidase maturation protein